MGTDRKLSTVTIVVVLSMLFTFPLFAQRHPECRCSLECQCGNGCRCYLNADHTCSCKHNHPHRTMANENVFLQMMDTMMTAMDTAPLDASAEGNFLRQMIPHHQGAVSMAIYEIVHGKNPEMIQLAKSILAEQQGEITEMDFLLKQYPLQEGTKPPAGYTEAMNLSMETMMRNTPSDAELNGIDVDCTFAMIMLPHHQAAVDIATAYLDFNATGTISSYAKKIISDQQIEIQQMQQYINQHCKH